MSDLEPSEALRRILEIAEGRTTESDDHEAMLIIHDTARKALGLPPLGIGDGLWVDDLFDSEGYYIGWQK